MDCRDVDKIMDPFFDRQLNDAAAEEVRAHLAGCTSCHRRWGSLQLLLSDPMPVEVPDGLRNRILTAWQNQQATPIPMNRSWHQMLVRFRYAGAIAACVLFFITGWLLSGKWGGPQPATVVQNPDRRGNVTVMVSPWILSSMAQAAAMPAPVNPAVMLASGVVPEMMIPEPRADKNMPWVHDRPSKGSASQPSNQVAPGIQFVPIPRYLGA